jgi:hypothetical protein
VTTLQVLLILTFRPEFTPLWIGRPHVTMLTLNLLPRRQGAEIIAHVTGGKALPKVITEQIISRTDGVPLFIEELTKTVLESGIVTEVGDHYAVARPMAPVAIPTSLQASLLARLDRLTQTREVAQIGAALGRSFSYDLISAVAGVACLKVYSASGGTPRRKISSALASYSRASRLSAGGRDLRARPLVGRAAWSIRLSGSGAQGPTALAVAHQMEEIGKTRNDAAMLLMGRLGRGLNCFCSGEFVTSRAVFEQCYDTNSGALWNQLIL